MHRPFPFHSIQADGKYSVLVRVSLIAMLIVHRASTLSSSRRRDFGSATVLPARFSPEFRFVGIPGQSMVVSALNCSGHDWLESLLARVTLLDIAAKVQREVKSNVNDCLFHPAGPSMPRVPYSTLPATKYIPDHLLKTRHIITVT